MKELLHGTIMHPDGKCLFFFFLWDWTYVFFPRILCWLKTRGWKLPDSCVITTSLAETVLLTSPQEFSFCHMFFSANTQVPDEGLAHSSYLIKCAVEEVKWPIPQLSQHAISSPLYFRVLPFPSCQWHRIYFPCSPLHPTLWSLAAPQQPITFISYFAHPPFWKCPLFELEVWSYQTSQ